MIKTEQTQNISQNINQRFKLSFVVMISIFVGFFSGCINSILDLKFGVTSGGLFDVGDSFVWSLWPGLIFGLVTLPWFFFLFYHTMSNVRKIIVPIFWLVSSVFSYYVSSSVVSDPHNINLALSGFVGAFIVVVAFNFLFQKIGILDFIFICLTGAMLPFLAFVPFALFPIWQGFIVCCLSIMSFRHVNKKTD